MLFSAVLEQVNLLNKLQVTALCIGSSKGSMTTTICQARFEYILKIGRFFSVQWRGTPLMPLNFQYAFTSCWGTRRTSMRVCLSDTLPRGRTPTLRDALFRPYYSHTKKEKVIRKTQRNSYHQSQIEVFRRPLWFAPSVPYDLQQFGTA